MKKIILLSFIIFLSISSYCQFTITSSNLPSVGSSFSIATLDTTGADHGLPGASQNWDFSSNTVKSTSTLSYVSPGGQPGASNFPSANMATLSGTAYVYYMTNTSTNTTLGIYQTSTGPITSIQIYSNPEVNFTFPFNYNTIQHDVFDGTTSTSQAGIVYITYRTGSDTATTDGYGTVKGPNGTTYDVVRVKTVQNFHDSTNIGSGFYQLQDRRYETYNYFQQNVGYPIISLSYYYTSITDYFGAVTSANNKSLAFYASGVSGISSNYISNETKTYPNPVSDKLNIELPENKVYNLTLSDMTGKAMLSSENGGITTIGNYAIANVAGLSKGIYMLQINTGIEKGVKKIVIE